MCGIAGIYWQGQRPDEAERMVDRMASVMHHRGPDSQGSSSHSFADVQFRRLSIIDLAGGSQPLRNEDGTIECFLNGEIFNHQELRQELIGRGHIFHTRSDTEVLPHLYEELGEGMFSRLNGMFCICVVDRRRNELLLARDHFGVKQMYYAASHRGIAFASELKGVLASGLSEDELDERGILAYLTLFYCPAPRTLIRGVLKLRPGHYLRLAPDGNVEPKPYYSLAAQTSYRGNSAGLREELLRRIERAVERQVQADVPLALSLSGGIDSTALLHAASRLGIDNFRAITVSYPDSSEEETADAAALCRANGIQHSVIRPDIGDLADELPQLAWVADEPVADPALYSQWHIARAASEHVKVLLSGAGGDELFGGYRSYILSWKRALYAASPEVVQLIARSILQACGTEADDLRILGEISQSRFAWHAFCMSSLTAADRAAIEARLPASRDPYEDLRQPFVKYADQDHTNQQMLADLHTYLPDQVLPMLDRATMAASIEGRVPFLDVELVSFAFSIPGRVKLGRPARAKRLLKESLRGRVPDSILRRSKAGLPSPVRAFLVGPGRQLTRDILLGPASEMASRLGRQCISNWLRDPAAHWRVLYSLLLLEVWYCLFVKNKSYEQPDVSLPDLLHMPRQTSAMLATVHTV